MDRTGALRGLIGKSGEIPARSRHCNGEQTHKMPLGRQVSGRCGLAEIRSQENCLFMSHRYYLRAMGRRLYVVLCTSRTKDSRLPSIAGSLFCFSSRSEISYNDMKEYSLEQINHIISFGSHMHVPVHSLRNAHHGRVFARTGFFFLDGRCGSFSAIWNPGN